MAAVKGRRDFEYHPRHKLTRQDCINIRKLFADGATMKAIASDYKVHLATGYKAKSKADKIIDNEQTSTLH